MKERNKVVLRSQSRYDKLLKGEIGGEDIKLHFVEEGTNPTSKGRELELSAHSAFLRPCGLIRAAIDNDQFAESVSGKIRIVIPPDTFDAVDVLLRWSYDGQCQLHEYVRKTDRHILDGYVTGVCALWLLADFLQCRELCNEIVSMLKAGGLRSGWAFANLIEEACDTPASSLIDAAVQGLPLKPEQRTQLEDIWLDYGGSELLGSLVSVYQIQRQQQTAVENVNENGGEVDSDNSSSTGFISSHDILNTFGVFLAEMGRSDRAKMTPIVFAQCITRHPPDTISELDYATLVLDYIEDRTSGISDDCIMALLGTIDFISVSQGGLQYGLIPRINKIFPSYAMLVNDFASVASTIITRCAFSSETLSNACDWAYTSCGSVLSKKTVFNLFVSSYTASPYHPRGGRNFAEDVTSIKCPLCKNMKPHKLERRDLIDYDSNYISEISLHDTNLVETERIQSYYERKCTKTGSLAHWVSLNESEVESDVESVAPRMKKRARQSESTRWKCVRILNQCSSLGGASVFFYRIDSLDSSVEEIMDAFIHEVGIHVRIQTDPPVMFFRSEPDGRGERLTRDMTWSQLEHEDGEINVIARVSQVAGKPVIRVYSDTGLGMEISLALNSNWSDVLTYPRANKSESADEEEVQLKWNVRVNPRDACGDHSSIIEHQQVDNGVWRKYSYLFWEASAMNGFSISVANASCVPSAELSNGLLQDALVAQGLSTDEATEMATHWLPDMTKKEFVLVEFLSREQIDDSMKLTVSPIPDTIHRVFMLFRPTDTKHSCEHGLVTSPAISVSREGCTVVEWGGMECY